MTNVARRQQPPITIRSTRATELLRALVKPGRSQADVIEEALEQMASKRMSIADALRPKEPLDFDWEPPRSQIKSSDIDLDD